MTDFFSKHRLLLKLLPVLAILCLIYFFSSQNAEQSRHESNKIVDFLISVFMPEGAGTAMSHFLDHIVRKIAHLTEFGMLGFFLTFVFDELLTHGEAKNRWTVGRCILFSWLSGTAAAAMDEWHQLFVAGRGPQFTDILIDSSGVMIGVLLAILCLFLLHSRRRKQQ